MDGRTQEFRARGGLWRGRNRARQAVLSGNAPGKHRRDTLPTADNARRQRKARRLRDEPNTLHSGRGTRYLLPESLRHMQELFELLPRLKLDANGDPDPRATDEVVLKRLATHAQASLAAMNLGMSAVGSLMAYAAPECEDKTISSDAIEALGWLLAELAPVRRVDARHPPAYSHVARASLRGGQLSVRITSAAGPCFP